MMGRAVSAPPLFCSGCGLFVLDACGFHHSVCLLQRETVRAASADQHDAKGQTGVEYMHEEIKSGLQAIRTPAAAGGTPGGATAADTGGQ
jgi:hypothetical protein